MNKNTLLPLVNEYSIRIATQLRDAGIDDIVILRILKDLETEIYANMAENIVEEFSEEELQEIEDTNSHQRDLSMLGLTEKDVTIYFLHALEDYMAALPANLPSIKEKYTSDSTNRTPH